MAALMHLLRRLPSGGPATGRRLMNVGAHFFIFSGRVVPELVSIQIEHHRVNAPCVVQALSLLVTTVPDPDSHFLCGLNTAPDFDKIPRKLQIPFKIHAPFGMKYSQRARHEK
jgi:hypothetical protein